MFGGIDPRKMQAMMKQMGIKQDDIEASRVVIEKIDGSKIVIDSPNVVKIDMKGQESWQITGEAREESNEESNEGFTEEDIRLIMEKTGKDYDKCKDALSRNEGDIAQCIVELSS